MMIGQVLGWFCWSTLAFVPAGLGATVPGHETVRTYRGMSDASAAVALTPELFVIADDEVNILRIYTRNGGPDPVGQLDVSSFLRTDPEHPEADIEGAARVGQRIYWIGSHGRNKDGKVRKARCCFFATDIVEGDRITLKPVGTVCTSLLDHMIRIPSLRRLGLAAAAGMGRSMAAKPRARLAPKKEGLNIEALSASADGSVLYIGFRNPRPGGRALILPLRNAARVVEERQSPVFGKPLLWNLQGMGMRAMVYAHRTRRYYLVAGPHKGRPGGVLYQWSGAEQEAPRRVGPILPGIDDFTPEALVVFSDDPGLWCYSDDGSLLVDIISPAECTTGEIENGQCPNKYLVDARRKIFRGARLAASKNPDF